GGPRLQRPRGRPLPSFHRVADPLRRGAGSAARGGRRHAPAPLLLAVLLALGVAAARPDHRRLARPRLLRPRPDLGRDGARLRARVLAHRAPGAAEPVPDPADLL